MTDEALKTVAIYRRYDGAKYHGCEKSIKVETAAEIPIVLRNTCHSLKHGEKILAQWIAADGRPGNILIFEVDSTIKQVEL